MIADDIRKDEDAGCRLSYDNESLDHIQQQMDGDRFQDY